MKLDVEAHPGNSLDTWEAERQEDHQFETILGFNNRNSCWCGTTEKQERHHDYFR